MKEEIDYVKESRRFLIKVFGGIALGCFVIATVGILLDFYKPFG